MTKLTIAEEREEDKYVHTTVLKSYEDGLEHPELSADPLVQSLSDGVLKSLSSARQSEVKSWEEEIVACEHTLTLEQLATGPIPASGLAHCSQCELKENLWLCLTCGSLGCGRKQYGGVPGGNGHGLNHFEETRHPISVKLGTITPEGGAGPSEPPACGRLLTFCLIRRILLYLRRFKNRPRVGFAPFDVWHQRSDTNENGKINDRIGAFSPCFRGSDSERGTSKSNTTSNTIFLSPMKTGRLSNPSLDPVSQAFLTLGTGEATNCAIVFYNSNGRWYSSCYMASVVQTLFSLPSFQKVYYPSAAEHWAACTEPLPADCVVCQMHKLADGLLSGRYSVPSSTREIPPLSHDSPTPVFQDGVRPMGFKALIGKGHEEFSTMRQQDSEEFFTHLLKVLRRTLKRTQDTAGEVDPTKVFTFAMEQRLQCMSCNRVRYRNDELDAVSVAVPAIEESKDAEGNAIYKDVLLTDTLDILTGDEGLEYTCPQCNKTVAYK